MPMALEQSCHRLSGSQIVSKDQEKTVHSKPEQNITNPDRVYLSSDTLAVIIYEGGV